VIRSANLNDTSSADYITGLAAMTRGFSDHYDGGAGQYTFSLQHLTSEISLNVIRTRRVVSATAEVDEPRVISERPK
jgi:hypothetical protein